MPSDLELIDKMLGDDDTLAVDKAKITADQAADDQSHADVVTLIQAKGKRGKLATDLSSVSIFFLNPDGTIGVEVVEIAAATPPVPTP